jgi:hypothetical protein
MKKNLLFTFAALALLILVSGADPVSGQKVKAIGKYLTVNFKPFFPIGLYSFPDRRNDDAVWKEAADAGFNFVLSQESGKYGIYVARAVPGKEVNGKKVSLMELYRDPSMQDDLENFIKTNEHDPTILCWHAPDEPSYFGPAANSLRLGYEAIKEFSKKPVWLNNGPSLTTAFHYNQPADFFKTCDIMSEDIYPIPEGYPKQGQSSNRYAYYVGEHTKKLVELGSDDGVQNVPIWMVIQGFGWGDLGQEDPKIFIPPTMNELRFMTYDAIVHGATGILFWGLRSTQDAVHAQLWKDLKSIATELKSNYDVWTCPFEMMTDKIGISYGDTTQANTIHCLLKLLDNRVVLLAVNTRRVPLKNVNFSVSKGGGVVTKVNVLNENRKIEVKENKSWTDQFEPYGVHIYETDMFFSNMRRYYKDPTVK